MRFSEYERNWAKSETVEMVFITAKQYIEGYLHKTAKVRVSDELAHTGDFIYLSDVKIFSPEDQSLLVDTDFLALNKSSIIFAMIKDSSRIHNQIGLN